MSDPLQFLSPAERRVIVHLMSTGSIDKIAAHELNISPRTLQTHKAVAFAKLQIKSVFELGALAVELGYFKTKSNRVSIERESCISRSVAAV